MKVYELIEALKKLDRDLVVAVPRSEGSDPFRTVYQCIETTERPPSGGDAVRCVMLNPTLAHIGREEDAREMGRESRAALKKAVFAKRPPIERCPDCGDEMIEANFCPGCEESAMLEKRT